MNRRHFLGALLPLLAASPLRAEYLKGDSPTTGKREQAIWLAALGLASLRLGKPDEQAQIAFFIDPNCPACAKLWDWFDTKPRRDLASVWIPVAYMNKTSAPRAIALLRASDPYAALAQDLRNFDHANWQGGIPPAQDATPEELSKIERSTQFWSKRLFGATPLMLYRAQDGVWQTVGMPSAAEWDQILVRLAPSRLEVYKAR